MTRVQPTSLHPGATGDLHPGVGRASPGSPRVVGWRFELELKKKLGIPEHWDWQSKGSLACVRVVLNDMSVEYVTLDVIKRLKKRIKFG